MVIQVICPYLKNIKRNGLSKIMKTLKIRFLNVFKKEFAATFRFLPLILGGMITPLLIFLVYGLVNGKYISLIDGHTYTQYIVSSVILFQLVFATFYQSSYNTYFSTNVTQTMDELLTSPLSSKDILIGRTLNTSLTGIIICIPVLAILMALSHIAFNFLFYLLAVLSLICIAFIFSLLGNLLGIVVNSEFSLINFANAIIIPLIFLSDTFAKVSGFNVVLTYVLYISPIKVANDVMRNALLNNKADLLDMLLLILYTFIYYAITYVVFEKKSRS
jgi:ABC-2 type transport system permease protein